MLVGLLVGTSPSLVNGEVPPAGRGCTLIGVTGSWTEGSDIFFAQSMDDAWWPSRDVVFVIQPKDGYKYIGTKASIWGFETGLNEKGFGITGAAVSATDTPDPNGISKFEIGPLLLEKCANVHEAIEFLESTPRAEDCWPRNMLMGDAEGNLALVEISYERINVETLTKDGYIVRTNFFISDEMKGVDRNEDPYYCERLARGIWWFENVAQKPIDVEDIQDAYGFIYAFRQDDPRGGPQSSCIIQPNTLTYWFTYGWPGGNLPTKELELRQICQNMTWGVYIPFHLPELPPGQYTTELGQLTPLAVQYLYSHFSFDVQRPPAWLKYQSEDPMAPFYKPAEDMVSPSGYTPKENPYGPGGMIGTWTPDEGFIPFEIPEEE